MKKGFLFTFDAVLALILVIILATALAAQQNALPEKGGVSSTLRQQAEDKAITGFYLNKTGESVPAPPVEYYECSAIYEMLKTPTTNNLGNREPVSKKIFCEKP